MKKPLTILGSNVSKFRDRCKMSIQDLSDITKISGTLLIDLEQGDISYLTLESVADIADALRVSVSDLTLGIPKSVVNEDIFKSEVKEIVKGRKYRVKAGSKTYIVHIDTKARHSSVAYPDARVCNSEGKDLPYGALSNVIGNMVVDAMESTKQKRYTKHGGP